MGNSSSGMNKNTASPAHKPKITYSRQPKLADSNHKEWIARLRAQKLRPLDAHPKPRHLNAPEMKGNPRSGDAHELPRKVVPKIIEISDDDDGDDEGSPRSRRSLHAQKKSILKRSGNGHSTAKFRKPMRNSDVDKEDVEGHQHPRGRDLLKPQILAHAPGLPPVPSASGLPLQRLPRASNGQDFDNEEVLDEELARAMIMDDFAESITTQSSPNPGGLPNFLENENPSQHAQSEVVMESRVDCIDQVVAVFPGICQDHVSELFDNIAQSPDRLIAHILDRMEKGSSYPKANDVQKTLKRKRELNEDEEAARKYGSADRIVDTSIPGTRLYVRQILSYEFPDTTMSFIDAALVQAKFRLFVAFRVLEEARRTYDPARPAYNKIKNARRMPVELQEQYFQVTIENSFSDPDKVDVLRELQACRRIKKKEDLKRQEEHDAKLEEERNIIRAEQDGSMSECGCCFDNHPINRMVRCNSDKIMHWFCRGCALRNAETEIGNSKYLLRCMSMDGCEGGFDLDQRSQFLDDKTKVALERNEQEAVLRIAGIENLASCPFCPFAAEYPPVEVDREFRCQAPDCEKVSCRLCKLESHIPKSCEENAKENGLSIRRQIEEAMSAALIRTCNKCNTPFVKEEGCNKMTCTRNGCFNVQCYVCSKSCGYDHFDDSRRGGKSGNCPLFEDIEQRHNSEVRKAEKEALEKVRAEHPEYTEEDLKINMSESVKKDDERRQDPMARLAAAQARAQAVRAVHARIRPLPYVHGIPDLPAFEDFYPGAEDEQEFLALFGNLPLPPHPAAQAVPRLRPIHLPQHPLAWRQPRAPDVPLPGFPLPRFAPQMRPIAHEQVNGQVNDADQARGYIPPYLRNNVEQVVRAPPPVQPVPPKIFDNEYLLDPIRQIQQDLEHNRQQQNFLRQRLARLNEHRHDAERRPQDRARLRPEEGQALDDALGRFGLNYPENP